MSKLVFENGKTQIHQIETVGEMLAQNRALAQDFAIAVKKGTGRHRHTIFVPLDNREVDHAKPISTENHKHYALYHNKKPVLTLITGDREDEEGAGLFIYDCKTNRALNLDAPNVEQHASMIKTFAQQIGAKIQEPQDAAIISQDAVLTHPAPRP